MTSFDRTPSSPGRLSPPSEIQPAPASLDRLGSLGTDLPDRLQGGLAPLQRSLTVPDFRLALPPPGSASPMPSAAAGAWPADIAQQFFRQLGQRISYHRATFLPGLIGSIVGFFLPQFLMVTAGFQSLQPLPARPFNVNGNERREAGTFLIGQPMAVGFVLFILVGLLGDLGARGCIAGYRSLRGQTADRPPPHTPLVDAIAADLGGMIGRHSWLFGQTLFWALAGFSVPAGMMTTACFQLLEPVPTVPFNSQGLDRRESATWVCGAAPPTSFAGTVMGICVGQFIGRVIPSPCAAIAQVRRTMANRRTAR